jgi:hypothetical protein
MKFNKLERLSVELFINIFFKKNQAEISLENLIKTQIHTIQTLSRLIQNIRSVIMNG